MDLFQIALVVFLLCYGVNYFVKNETLGAVAAIAAVVAGVVGLVRLVQ
ncbi:hypothetical protein H0W80_02795 [Candidatus Saccharibacteria bacterium]|nr:hypothetical protein [Candidatus Saccharibacteria bacterium]